MFADQVVVRWAAPAEVVRGAGRLRYVRAPTIGTGTCSASTATSSAARTAANLVADRKTGFCLGDRYAVTRVVLPARPPRRSTAAAAASTIPS